MNVRYGRELRNDLGSLRRVLVATPNGAQVPLGELVDLRFVDGPGAIKSEAAQLVGYVYVDLAGRDTGGYMNDARQGRRQDGEVAGRATDSNGAARSRACSGRGNA